jgi:hypothetical protein
LPKLETIMRIIVISFCLAVIMCFMLSCGQKQWVHRGEKKGWIGKEIDTIVTKSVETKTVFKNDTITDTVFVRKDNLTMKYFYNNRDSTVYLWGKCDGDTVYVDKQIIHMQEFEVSFLKDHWFEILVLMVAVFLFFWHKRK